MWIMRPKSTKRHCHWLSTQSLFINNNISPWPSHSIRVVAYNTRRVRNLLIYLNTDPGYIYAWWWLVITCLRKSVSLLFYRVVHRVCSPNIFSLLWIYANFHFWNCYVHLKERLRCLSFTKNKRIRTYTHENIIFWIIYSAQWCLSNYS